MFFALLLYLNIVIISFYLDKKEKYISWEETFDLSSKSFGKIIVNDCETQPFNAIILSIDLI